ncbi:MAG: PSD1 and planctomycete cytochrome C domain-containing protein [Planctomycetota bacterium]|nr:PSD1 and planctomycete cytochrome C domain-containing protein [Planctomycetota bacterium]
MLGRHANRLVILLVSFYAVELRAGTPQVDFGRDVLPILSDRCFQCHGPDATKRVSELRLDRRESATTAEQGDAAVVPGDTAASQLIRRITSEDPDIQMPPPGTQRQALTGEQVALLVRWVQEGAPWGRHWAFEPPRRPEIGKADEHPIDTFVKVRLEREGLAAAPPAPRHTLLRRLSFDLTGLPPTTEELAAFVDVEATDPYEAAVDRLLASPHYGERMAMWWLDAARYSDTDGYQGDSTRSNWPWRDWVIDAFRNNMPFDQFTIEQFAGDLLPQPTPEQVLATCFHRNHMTNGEGGRDPEESRIDYVIDRINTTGTVWLGLTLGCAQCHSHKFDPVSQQDYYGLFAFFDSIDEDGRAGGGAKPFLSYRSPYAQRALREAEELVALRKETFGAIRRDTEAEFESWLATQLRFVEDGFEPWETLRIVELQAVAGTVLKRDRQGVIQASGPHPRQDDYRVVGTSGLGHVTGLRLEVFPHETHTEGKLGRGGSGEFILTDVKLQLRRRGQAQVREIEIASALADAEKNVGGRNYGRVSGTLDDDPRNGWTTETHDAKKPHVALFALAQPLQLHKGEELVFVMYHRSTVGDANVGRFRISVTDQPGPAVKSLDKMPLEALAAAEVAAVEEIPGPLRTRLREQFLSTQGEFQRVRAELQLAEQQLAAMKQAVSPQRVMVLGEREKPRSTFLLERGVWDQKGRRVTSAVPSSILGRKPGSQTTRLHLANWLVDRDNPLTARVVVNQLWQLFFGAGLVRTPEDFGLQGEYPTHPKLLDWLAVDLMDHGWDLKRTVRQIVMSHVYRQDSRMSAVALERDPENRLLARGARFRLPSWMIRDTALRSSGLLNSAIGGPPVRPYQPAGVWSEMFMGRFRYQPSQGPAQYRRTLYAFWRRSAAPTFLFDSSQRRVCEVRPRHTNTPMHALTLLNDLNMLASARALARRVVDAEEDVTARLDMMSLAVVSRRLTPAERGVLLRELQHAQAYYEREPPQALALLAFGQPEQRPARQPAEIAAYLLVASMIYNLDEAITHE